MSNTVIIVIAVVAVIVLWFIATQNGLVKKDEICTNALKQINVQQVSRYDVILAQVKLVREYASYEAETFQKTVEARKITASASPTAAEINANEEVLKEVSAKLIAIAEAYPDLKANQSYQKAMDSIEKYEENVRLSRMTFNDTVTIYNRQVRSFPASIVAGILGFGRRDYLAEDTKRKEFPSF